MNQDIPSLGSCPCCGGVCVWCDSMEPQDHECDVIICTQCKMSFEMISEESYTAKTIHDAKVIAANKFNSRPGVNVLPRDRNIDVGSFKKELSELLKKYDATIGVDIDGDTHNLRYNFILADRYDREQILVDGYRFIDWKDLK